MKNWKYILSLFVLIMLFGLYIKGYTYGVNSDNSNIRMKDEVDKENPVLSGIVYNYYIKDQDDYVVVFKKDKKTVYMETGILVNSLDENDAKMIKAGIPVEDITALYAYLESFTS